MATRRKYKARAGHVPADVNVAAAPAPAPPIAPAPAPKGVGASPLQRALEAQRHAEALQHQHGLRQAGLAEPPIDATTRQAVDAHIDAIPGLTDHKKRFLKSHPSLLQAPYLQLMQHAYMVALPVSPMTRWQWMRRF